MMKGVVAFLPSFSRFNFLRRKHICFIEIGINHVTDEFSAFKFEL